MNFVYRAVAGTLCSIPIFTYRNYCVQTKIREDMLNSWTDMLRNNSEQIKYQESLLQIDVSDLPNIITIDHTYACHMANWKSIHSIDYGDDTIHSDDCECTAEQLVKEKLEAIERKKLEILGANDKLTELRKKRENLLKQYGEINDLEPHMMVFNKKKVFIACLSLITGLLTGVHPALWFVPVLVGLVVD